VVLEKAKCGVGEGQMWCWRRPNQLDGSCEKLIFIKNQRSAECPIYSRKKEGYLDRSHLVWELPSENTLLQEKN